MNRASLRVWPALLLVLAGCKSLPFPLPRLEGEYGELIRSNTREVSLYGGGGLETRAFVQIVWLTPAMVEGQAKLISGMREEPPAEQAQTLLRLRAGASTPTFFAIVRTPHPLWNDWDEKNSVWRVAVDFGGGQFLPERVERVERPFNAELQQVYPYLDEYSVAYVLHFPAAAGPGAAAAAPASTLPAAPASAPALKPVIIVSGALGHMRFDWTVPAKD